MIFVSVGGMVALSYVCDPALEARSMKPATSAGLEITPSIRRGAGVRPRLYCGATRSGPPRPHEMAAALEAALDSWVAKKRCQALSRRVPSERLRQMPQALRAAAHGPP